MKSSFRLVDRLLHRIEALPGSDRLLVRLAFFAVIGTGIWLMFAANQEFSATTPTRGGSFTEGIIGTPRFVNPALALTRADQDITALVYSGLMKIGPNGTLENDIAESIDISEDGRVYSITVRSDIVFHDGTPLTARDVVFTLHLIQDQELKSPLRGNWTEVTVEEVGEYSLQITLKEAYAPFIENFTVGIMPAHIWSSIPIEQLPFSQLNTEPIGSGPFSVAATKRDASKLIQQYTLSAFRESGSTDPKIDTVYLNFYQNTDELFAAMIERQIDATAYLSPEQIDQVPESYELIEEPLPRIFGIFFNQNRSPALRDMAARKALAAALDRDALIEITLHGYGVPITAPTTFGVTELESASSSASSTPTEAARTILEDGGWQQTESGQHWEKEIDGETITLGLTLRTSNTPLFQSLVDSVAAQWREIGVEVVTEQFEQTGLIQSVIRPREFEALLYGLDISRSYDLYPFWHSSQQDDPGLNISQYANVRVDELLESTRTEQSTPDRHEILAEASDIITAEQPAVFLFQPTLTYVFASDITVSGITQIGRASDRLSNITDWHTESDSLWPLFRNDM